MELLTRPNYPNYPQIIQIIHGGICGVFLGVTGVMRAIIDRGVNLVPTEVPTIDIGQKALDLSTLGESPNYICYPKAL